MSGDIFTIRAQKWKLASGWLAWQSIKLERKKYPESKSGAEIGNERRRATKNETFFFQDKMV